MTDKERLESLKRNREWTEATGGKFYTVDSDDYKWLIKQAERVQELEKQNKRYRKALEEIRDIGICGRIISTGEIIRSDEANLAEEALEGEE